MKRIFTNIGLLALALAFLLTGCQASQSGAASAIQKYLQARAASDVDQMTLLSCPAWEAQARVEAASFKSMNARLEGVTCQVSGSDTGSTLVTCQGKIVTTYQGEARQWSVGDHPFKVVQQDGEWRMCGYAN
jgi:outer membrane lipoprotein SlyB